VNTEEATRIRRALLANGYVPLASKDKRCFLKNWTSLDVDDDLIDDWASRGGLLGTAVRMEGDLLALDFDIDDEDMLDCIWDAVWNADKRLGRLLDQMPLRAGGGAKICLFARLETGKMEQFWSKAFYRPGDLSELGDKAKTHRLEVFSGSSGGGRRYVGVYGPHSHDDTGEVKTWYRWADGRGLVEVPLADLPSLRRKDVVTIVDTVSRAMFDAGWDHETAARHGKITSSTSYTLLPTTRFATDGGDVVDLEGLEALARDGAVRVSLGFCEQGAVNTSRGLVGISPRDDRVYVWDSATATTYRPADEDTNAKASGLGARLHKVGLLTRDGLPTVAGPTGRGEHAVRLPSGGGESGNGEDGNEGECQDSDAEEVLVGGDGRLLVQVGDGELTNATWLVGRWLAAQDDLYQRGGVVTTVVRERDVVSMTQPRLAVEIGGRVCCLKEETSKQGTHMVEADPPLALVRQVESVVGEVGFRELRGVVDVPVVRRDGSLLMKDGWDRESRLLVRVGGRYDGRVTEVSSDEDVDTCVKVLMHPFRAFPFIGAESRGALLAALLTAVVRPALPTSPAFALDAPAAGSGKTLLGQCLMALAGGGTLYAPLPVKQEEEVAKVLLAVLRDKPKAALFDNQIGLLDSASLAAMLTSENYSGRILGQTAQVQMDTGMLVLFSGNNMAIVGDMTRRVLSIRIDPECEIPALRSFDFDPLREVRTNRENMVIAALRLIRWAKMRNPTRQGRIGSFEAWDEIVGLTVADLAAKGFSDPAGALQTGKDADPRMETTANLMHALRGVFGSCWFRSSDIMSVIRARHHKGHETISGVLEDALPKLSAISIGMYLRNRKDTRVDGLTLKMEPPTDKKNPARFRVASVEDTQVVHITDWRAEKARAEAR
jgi:hypothetical protein